MSADTHGDNRPRRGRGRGRPVSGYSRTRRLDLPERGVGTLPRPIPEDALYPVVAAYLTAQGLTCWRDVSFLGSWIDLYARRENSESVAIELKVADWRRALQQALLARGSAERTYVGLWAPYVHRALTPTALRAFRAAGVGLLGLNGACEIKIEAAHRRARFGRYVILPARASHRPR